MSNIPEAVIARREALVQAEVDIIKSRGLWVDELDAVREAFDRFIAEVSETAKAWKSAWDAGKLAPLAVRAELSALILPDPEPDVLAELLGSDFELTWAGHEASADDLRTELAKRGYAITKTGEAGQ